MAKEMVPVPANRVREISKQSGLPVEKVGLGVILLGGEPYFTSAGMEILMDQKYQPGRWGVEMHFPGMEEYKVIRWMAGAQEQGAMAYVKCRLERIGLADIWEHATVTKKNAPMLGDRNPIELATTRAQNRAMRKALGHGFSPFPVWDGDPGEERSNSKPFIPQTGSPQAGFLKAMQELKKQVGEESYYGVLTAHGFEKSNEHSLMNDVEMMEQVVATICGENEIEISTVLPGSAKNLLAPDPPPSPDEVRDVAKEASGDVYGAPEPQSPEPAEPENGPEKPPEGPWNKSGHAIEEMDIAQALLKGEKDVATIRNLITSHPAMAGEIGQKFITGLAKKKSPKSQEDFLIRAQVFILQGATNVSVA